MPSRPPRPVSHPASTTAFRETGGALGVAVVGAIFAASKSRATAGGASPAHAFVAGYSQGLQLAGVLMIAAAAVAAVAALTLGRRAATAPTAAATAPTVAVPGPA